MCFFLELSLLSRMMLKMLLFREWTIGAFSSQAFQLIRYAGIGWLRMLFFINFRLGVMPIHEKYNYAGN